jgi:protein-S-isoprenylcysteine O-methyltransferase Ste14
MTNNSESLPELHRFASKYRILISAVAGILFIVFSKPDKTSMLVGLPFIFLGEAIRVMASGHIDKNDRITREGPYSISRNPLYIGNFILGVGFITAAGNPWLAPFFLLFFFFMYNFTIKYEEKFLARIFPDEWDDYVSSVPRILGWRSLSGYTPGEFKWGLVKKHREFNNIPGFGLIYVILMVKYLWF